jgi:hypothetical protein
MAYKKILLRRDTASNWTSANPTLSGGEMGVETDTLKFKLGNGSTAWNSLNYYAPPSLDEVGDVTITSASSGQFLKWNGSAWVNDEIDLGTDTTGGYVASLVAGTGVTLSNNSGETATPTIAIGQAVATDSNVTFADVTVSGNLTVSGSTTTLNTETLTVNDNIIVLNNNASGAPSENAGIEVERGSSANVQIRWNETTDVWEATVDGSVYSPLVTELELEERLGEEHWHEGVVLATNAVLPNTPTYENGTADADGGLGIGATLTGTSNGRLVVDTENASTGDRILVKNQANTVHNGIYVVTNQGSAEAAYVLTRATDMNGSTTGQITQNEGFTVGSLSDSSAVNRHQGFAVSSVGSGADGAHVLGTDAVTFQQTTGLGFQIIAGAGLAASNSDLSIGTASSDRIVVNSDSIDLAEVARTNTTVAAGKTFVTAVNTDAYGRVSAVNTGDALLALGTDTTGDYVANITGGTGVTSTAATSGEGTTHTLSIGQAVGTGDSVTFSNLTLSGSITMEGSSVDDHELQISAGNPTADRTVTFQDATGTVALLQNTLNNFAVATDTLDLNSQKIQNLANPTVNNDAANKGYVDTADALKAPLESPTFTGTVTLPSGTVTSEMIADGAIVNADIDASAAIVDTKLATITTASKVANSATTATDANTASAIVARDASGNFTAGTITAALTGNASTATTLATARNIAGQSFDGSANISIAPTDLTGVTSTAAEINILDGATLSVTELNYVDGVTSAIQTQLDNKAPLASPALTGTPTAPTASAVTNDTQIATTAFVATAVANLVDSAPAALNTLDELANALGDDANFATTVSTNIGLKANTASPTFTGTVTIPTGSSITLPTVSSGANYAGSTSGSTKLEASAIASGTITLPAVTGTVVTTGDTGTVTSAMLVDGTIVDADINASAAIALSKLATSTAGNIIVFNSSGVPTAVAETGDVTISDTGVTAIASGVIVNADVSASAAIELGKLAEISTSAQSDSYTLVLADKTKIVEMSVAGANTLTVPLNSSVAFPVGSQINILQTGAGQTTIAATAGVTINATPGLKIRAQWSYATLIKRATDTWVLVGDISA